MTDLTGSTTVITGGAGGLGRALALEASRRGARVLIADVVDASETVELITQAGGTADWLETDVSDYASVQRFVEYAQKEHDDIRVVINDAGVGAPGGVDVADPEAVARVFDVNIRGYFNVVRAFADILKAQAAAHGSAYVLNIGSEHSLGVPPYVMPISTYTISKYAQLGLTDTARRDFAGTGVNVTLLAPGWLLTERIAGAIAGSNEFASAVAPYAQPLDVVTKIAFDGLLAGRYIVVTNPKSVPFAREQAESVLAELAQAEQAGTTSSTTASAPDADVPTT